jgi:hypothetical protein
MEARELIVAEWGVTANNHARDYRSTKRDAYLKAETARWVRYAIP